jgi:hypothetical protein
MAVFVSNIVIEQGFDFDTTFILEDTTTGDYLDLTNYTVSSQLRKTYTSSSAVSFTSIIANPTLGQVQISLGSTVTSDIKSGRYVFDVKVISSGGSISKVVEGAALVRPGVTR